MRRFWLVLIGVLLLAAACSKTEKADNLAALTKQPLPPAGAPSKLSNDDLKQLIACCDENARAMGAACCVQLENLMKSQMASKEKGQEPAGPTAVKTGRPVQIDPAVAAKWPRVKLQVGPKNGPLADLILAVGEKKKIDGTALEIEVQAFAPNFKMTGEAIVSDGAEPANPAARVVIREAGKPEWSGWLFAKMPDVHAFEHATTKVILIEGVGAAAAK